MYIEWQSDYHDLIGWSIHHLVKSQVSDTAAPHFAPGDLFIPVADEFNLAEIPPVAWKNIRSGGRHPNIPCPEMPCNQLARFNYKGIGGIFGEDYLCLHSLHIEFGCWKRRHRRFGKFVSFCIQDVAFDWNRFSKYLIARYPGYELVVSVFRESMFKTSDF